MILNSIAWCAPLCLPVTSLLFQYAAKPKRYKLNSRKVEASLEQIQSTLGDTADDTVAIKEMLSKVLTLATDSNLPIALKVLLQDTFKCAICTGVPIKPPVIATKCCRSILGCEACVNGWFSGDDACTKMCPKCRGERGLAETMRLHGLDDFLLEIQKIFSE